MIFRSKNLRETKIFSNFAADFENNMLFVIRKIHL